MFAYLEGELTYKSPSVLYMSVNGVGYELNITLQTYEKIQSLTQCRLYTHLQIREDAWVLYGFADEQERATFRSLLSISGVGAATARIILSSLTPEELHKAVAYEDSKTLEKVKGIGGKTAQRIILELKGKLSSSKTTGLSQSVHNTKEDDALMALVNLGINKAVAENTVKKVAAADTGLSVEELIKQALRAL